MAHCKSTMQPNEPRDVPLSPDFRGGLSTVPAWPMQAEFVARRGAPMQAAVACMGLLRDLEAHHCLLALCSVIRFRADTSSERSSPLLILSSIA